jgi:hypothetical protein
MTPDSRRQLADLLRNTAAALKGLDKFAAEKKAAGPVINVTKLRSLLHGTGKKSA